MACLAIMVMHFASSEQPAAAVEGLLQLREYDGAPLYFLAEKPLPSGTEVEVLLAEGNWLRGTFEWNGQAHRWPGLRLRLGGSRGSPNAASLVAPIHPATILRLPRQ